jgi:hypothetical protein
VQQRFEYPAPLLGSKRHAVVLFDDGVRFEMPFLKQPLVVAKGDVSCIVRIREIGGEEPLLARDVRRLDLVASMQDANTVFLFSSSAHIDRFTYGAERGIRVSARERRRGCDIDCLGVIVEDPDRLHRAASDAGYRTRNNLGAELINLFGAASGQRLLEQRSSMRRSRLRAGALLSGWGLLFAGLISTRLALGGNQRSVDVGEAVGTAVAAIVWAMLVAVVALTVVGPRSPRVRPVRDSPSGRRAVTYMALMLVGCLVPFLLAVAALNSGAVARPVALGLAGGLPGGVFTALGLRVAFRDRQGT